MGGSYYGSAPDQHPKQEKTREQQKEEDRTAKDVATAIQEGYYNWNENRITSTPAGVSYSDFNGSYK